MRRLMPNRKGDLTINTIIVAAIGLLVLIVLIGVFTGQIGIFTKGISAASADKSKCVTLCNAQGYPGGSIETSSCSKDEIFSVFDEKNAHCCCNPKTEAGSPGATESGDIETF